MQSQKNKYDNNKNKGRATNKIWDGKKGWCVVLLVFIPPPQSKKRYYGPAGLIWVIERIKAVLRYFYCKISQKCKASYSLQTTTSSYSIFTKLLSAIKQVLQKINYELLHAFCTWNNEASSCLWNIMTLRLNIPYTVNSFVFPLDIPAMINISYDLIKILHEKMLNAINIFVLIPKRHISWK